MIAPGTTLKLIDPHKTGRLLVRCPNWIGDAVMATPALGDLRKYFPHARISIAANPAVSELLSFHPFCDEVLVYDRKDHHRGMRGLSRFARTLRREKFDLAILLQNAAEAAVLAFWARIPQRAGYMTDGRRMLLTHGVPVSQTGCAVHQVSYYRRMLDFLGISGGEGTLRLQCSPDEIEQAEKHLGRGFWIGLNPGAAYGSAKRWNPKRFAETADRLHREFSARIVLTGGSGETELGREIAAEASCSPLNLIGRTTVREMMAFLSCCRLVVSNDSGPMHVASALGVPVVALFGPTDPSLTGPWSDDCRVVRRKVPCAPCRYRDCPTDHSCMTTLEVDDVVAAARDLWEGRG